MRNEHQLPKPPSLQYFKTDEGEGFSLSANCLIYVTGLDHIGFFYFMDEEHEPGKQYVSCQKPWNLVMNLN